jgi:hypothetical protein
LYVVAPFESDGSVIELGVKLSCSPELIGAKVVGSVLAVEVLVEALLEYTVAPVACRIYHPTVEVMVAA